MCEALAEQDATPCKVVWITCFIKYFLLSLLDIDGVRIEHGSDVFMGDKQATYE